MPYASRSPARFSEPYPERQAFHRPNSSLGAAAHYVKEAGILAPFLVSEFVKDPGEQWRWIRLASLFTAFVSQGMYTARIHAERKARREREPQHYSRG